MRKPIVYKFDLGGADVWWCAYEDEQSTQNFLSETPDPIGNGDSPQTAYEDFLKELSKLTS